MVSDKSFLTARVLAISVVMILILIGAAMGQTSSNPITGGWLYRQQITISNSGSNLTDYQVTWDTAELISARKMRSDCADIRFTDFNGSTQLNYWLEYGCNTNSTKLWVKVPNISSYEGYVYYRNFGANSTSDENYVLENTYQELIVSSAEETIRRAGDSIYFGDGYTLLIKEIDPESGNVWIELQLNGSTIDSSILNNSDIYELYKNDNKYDIKLVDIYHDTTGDYVILNILPPLVAYFDLIISSIPQGANIWIDNNDAGKTSKTIPIADLEEHSLRLNLSGYYDENRTFKFEQNEGKKEIPITLTPLAPSSIPTVTGTPTATVAGTQIATPTAAVTGTPRVAPTAVVTGTPISTPTPTAVPFTPSPIPPTPQATQVPGFLAILFILAILCGYLILKKWH